jgi:DDE superfamily endonuclease
MHSSLSRALNNNSLSIPCTSYLPNSHTMCPYMIVADEAFPLKTYIMKPYARRGLTDEERVFNYRLSRARRVVENAFGILAHRFRVFLTPINSSTSSVTQIVLAAVLLHNFMKSRQSSARTYFHCNAVDLEDTETGTLTPGTWSQDNSSTGMVDLTRRTCGNSRNDAKDLRNSLAKYFMHEGWRIAQ